MGRRMSVRTVAAVVENAGDPPVLRDVELADPGPDEVLVRPMVAGICHSDVGWAAGGVYDRFPVVLGHEVAGVVAAVGATVTTVRPGDRVAIALAHSCGQCRFCQSGRPILCARRTDSPPRISLAGRPVHQGFGTGGFAELMMVRQTSVLPIPEGVPFDVAATVGCATSTGLGSVFNVAEVRYGSKVAVIGAGAVGLCVAMGCRLAGAEQIVVADGSDARRRAALGVGATDVVPAGEEALREMAADGYEFVFESAGTVQAMELAVRMTERGGTTTLIGVASPGTPIAIDAQRLVTAQGRILGSLTGNVRPHVDFDKYFRLYRRGLLPLDELITGSVPLSGIAEGFDRSASGLGVKTMVRIGGD